jgi:hypothetical protein
MHFSSRMKTFWYRMLISVLLFFCWQAAVVPTTGQEVQSVFGPLPVFEFHSGFWVNLHHFLYYQARARDAAKNPPASATRNPGPAIKLGSNVRALLSPIEQKTWDAAIAYYSGEYAHKDMQVNIDLILLKNQLGDFEDCDELTGKKKRTCDAGLPGGIGALLESVAAIYRAHWWTDHDRANRRWVARVAPLVREQGVGLSERLADVYQTKWPGTKIRVEVVAAANPSGAYTTLDPLRVTIASTDTRNQGSAALEVLFHEASHGIAEPVEAAISRECKQRNKAIPRDLWHALIVYTAAEVLRPVVQDAGTDSAEGDLPPAPQVKPDSVPYVLQETLSQRGWEQYHLMLVLYWQPYLEGKVSFENAIAHLVSAL